MQTKKWLKIKKEICPVCNEEKESVLGFEKKSGQQERIVRVIAHKCQCERTLINEEKIVAWKQK